MNRVVLGEGEAGAEVFLEEGSLVSLQVLEEGIIDGLLEGDALGGTGLLLVFVEYVSALGLGVLVFEGGVVDLGDVGTLHVDLGARGDGVNLVHALQGDTVDLEGSAHEEETVLELLEEHASLATVLSRGEDENGTGLDSLAQLGGARLLLAGLTLLVLSRVPVELLDH